MEECDPGYPGEEPFLTRKVNVGLVSNGPRAFCHWEKNACRLRSWEVPAACWATEWSPWAGEMKVLPMCNFNEARP